MNDTIIQAYVNAIKKGKLTINDVPEFYKELIRVELEKAES